MTGPLNEIVVMFLILEGLKPFKFQSPLKHSTILSNCIITAEYCLCTTGVRHNMWGYQLLAEGVVSSLATDFINVIHYYIEQVLPCQCTHLLVRQFPVFAGTAAACPLLSGHNVPHTAPAFDSENSKRTILK